MMNVEILKQYGTWRDVADACRETVGKEAGTGEPSNVWKLKILRAEHSPIRLMRFLIRITDLKYWIAMELRTHKIGVYAPETEYFIQSQRSDRTGMNRDELRQDTLVSLQLDINVQALINISRKRLCLGDPHHETREVWKSVIDKIRECDPVIATSCVPECIYRGSCFSMKKRIEIIKEEVFKFDGCGYIYTQDGIDKLFSYQAEGDIYHR